MSKSLDSLGVRHIWVSLGVALHSIILKAFDFCFFFRTLVTLFLLRKDVSFLIILLSPKEESLVPSVFFHHIKKVPDFLDSCVSGYWSLLLTGRERCQLSYGTVFVRFCVLSCRSSWLSYILVFCVK